MPQLLVRQFHQPQPYELIFSAMKNFTAIRTAETNDELWLLEHTPVYTQGLAGKAEHLLHPGNIPVVQSDRGGQITYHGPGQLMLYTLLDLNRLALNPRDLVCALERVIITYLQDFDVQASRSQGAPGVYVNQKKIASIGLRVKKGCSYHGLAFNINMDLTPFSGINPCGYHSLKMTQLADFAPNITLDTVKTTILSTFCQVFGYNTPLFLNEDTV